MSAAIFVHTIGTVAIDLPDRRVSPSAGRPFALLLYLASQRGEPTPRRIMQDLLYPASPRERSAHSLRQLLYRARSAGWPVNADDDQIRLTADRIVVDWADLLDAHTIADGDLERLGRGLFPGYAPDISEAFRNWFDLERTTIVRRLNGSLTTQLGMARRAGRWDLVESAARALLALDPLSEEGMLAKAEVLAATGSKRAALGVIDGYLEEVGNERPQLRLVPTTVKQRISERLPDESHRAMDERLFVGREEQMRLLSAFGAATGEGTQQILFLWGEPGVGKTRLIAEYRALAALQGALTVWAASRPHDVFRPLGILGDLVMQLLEAPGALGCDPGARALLQRLVKANRAIDGTREAAVAEVSSAAVVRSLSDLLSAVASEAPLQVFVDDAQWMDESSRTVILGAFAGGASRRSNLVLASRERGILAGAERYTDGVVSMRLSPLDRGAARALTYRLLKSSRAEDIEEAAQQVLEQARGNPFVIRMICAHYLQTSDAASIRQTLTEILTRRLERLAGDARHALEASVILAKNCTLERLERLLEVSRHQLLLMIEELDAQGLIDVTDGYIVRTHDLLADAVRERMAPLVRRLLHGAAAQLLHNEVELSANGALLWDCAEHWRESGNDERAVSVLVECADRSLEAGRATDAVLTLRRALTLNASDVTRLSIVEKAVTLSYRNNVYDQSRFFLSELAGLRRALGRPVQMHDHFELLEVAMTRRDGLSDFRSLVRKLRACATAADATRQHRAGACHWLIVLAEAMLDHEASDFGYRVMKEEYEHIAELELGTVQRAVADMIYHACFGDADKARAVAREITTLVKEDSADELPMLVNAGLVQYRIAPPREAEETLRRTLACGRRCALAVAETNVVLTLARLFWSTERVEESVAWHREMAEVMRHEIDAEIVVDYCVLGARLATMQGRYDDAAAHVERARAIPYSQLPLPDLLLRCCELDIRLATGDDSVDDAELDELLALHVRARGFGLQDEVTWTVLKCLERKGRSEEGRRLLEEYLRRYRRDGFPVPSWLSGRIASRPVDVSPVVGRTTRESLV